jgi:hypothetical protein
MVRVFSLSNYFKLEICAFKINLPEDGLIGMSGRKYTVVNSTGDVNTVDS